MSEAKPGAGATPCKILSVTSDKSGRCWGGRQVAVVMAVGRADVHGSRVLMASACCCQPERFERHRIRAPRDLAGEPSSSRAYLTIDVWKSDECLQATSNLAGLVVSCMFMI